MRTERFVLQSGLTVVVRESHAAPVVSMALAVGVGSADEEDSERGLAHVMEHMIFKGTSRRGVGEIAATVESCGGAINAFTSLDETVFYLTLSSRFVEEGLDVLGDALSRPAFDAVELERELEVIAEELRRSDDQPHALAIEALFAGVFREHPYGRPVGGTEASVAALGRAQVVAFFERWYVASNMTLVVVGDTSLGEVRALVARHFGELRTGPRPARERPVEPPQRGPRVELRPTGDAEVLVRMAFRTGGMEIPEAPALDALSILLGGGEASRLVHGIEYERGWVNDIGATTFRGMDVGLFGVTADLQVSGEHPGVLAVLGAIFDVLAEVGRVAPGEEELARVRTLVLSREVYQRQSVEGQAMSLAAFESLQGGWEAEVLYEQRLAGLRCEELRRVASSVFAADGASVVLYGTREALEGLEAAAVEALLVERLGGRASRPGVEPTAVVLDARGMARLEVPGGPVMVVQRVPGVESVSLRLVGFGGVEAEPLEQLGLTNMLARLWTRGTAHHSGPELAAKMEAMAGALYGSSGKSTVGIRLDGLSRFLPESLELLVECLDSPTFAEEELERERRLVLEGIRARRDDVASVAHILLHEALYGDHPYGREASGVSSTVSAIDRASLLSCYAEQVRPSRMVLAVVGDIDVGMMVDWASEHLVEASPAARGGVERPPLPPLEGPLYWTTAMEREQVWLHLGLRTSPLGERERVELQVLAAVLSGQGGRLFMELRDRRSLVYAVHAYHVAGLVAGEFVLGLSTSPSKVEASVEALLSQLEALAREGVGEAELSRAQRYLVGHNDIALQRIGSRANRFCLDELYGLGHDATWQYADRIMAVTAQEVRQAACELSDLARAALVMVHPVGFAPPSFAHLGLGEPRPWSARE